MNTRVEVHGLDELRKSLRRITPALSKQLQVANKTISTKLVPKLQGAVRSLPSPGGFRTGGGIRPRATQKSATIAFLGSQATKPLQASVLGSNVHPIFGRLVPASSMSRRLWRPHLGNSWTPEQLYGVGPIFRTTAEQFAPDEYLDAVIDAIEEGFRA